MAHVKLERTTGWYPSEPGHARSRSRPGGSRTGLAEFKGSPWEGSSGFRGWGIKTVIT